MVISIDFDERGREIKIRNFHKEKFQRDEKNKSKEEKKFKK